VAIGSLNAKCEMRNWPKLNYLEMSRVYGAIKVSLRREPNQNKHIPDHNQKAWIDRTRNLGAISFAGCPLWHHIRRIIWILELCLPHSHTSILYITKKFLGYFRPFPFRPTDSHPVPSWAAQCFYLSGRTRHSQWMQIRGDSKSWRSLISIKLRI